MLGSFTRISLHTPTTLSPWQLPAELVTAKVANDKAELAAALGKISDDEVETARAVVSTIEAKLRGLDAARQESVTSVCAYGAGVSASALSTHRSQAAGWSAMSLSAHRPASIPCLGLGARRFDADHVTLGCRAMIAKRQPLPLASGAKLIRKWPANLLRARLQRRKPTIGIFPANHPVALTHAPSP
jgi:hypothetical protein